MSTRRSAQFSPEAEAAVLGSLLVVPENIYEYELTEILAPEDFADRRHRAVYAAILACESENKPYWDLVVLADELTRQGTLAKIGGREFVESLLTAPGEASSIKAHIDIVVEKSLLRRISGAGQKMVDAASAHDAVAAEVLEEAESTVFALGERGERDKFVYMTEAMRTYLEEEERVRGKEVVGLSTGFPTLDKVTSGFQPGQLILLAGRPGMGKSSAGLQIARHVAETGGDHVLFVSYEMTRLELLTRMISMAVGVSAKDLRTGRFSAEVGRELALERQRLTQLPLGIHDRPPSTIAGMRSALRREVRKRPVSMVVIDYVQLMAGSRTENRNQEVTEISRGLKLLAQELGIPFLALAQLNRGVEVRGTDRYRPRLSDLRDSGSLEQDADTVLFVNRPVLIQPSYDPKYSEIIVAKQRAGEAGVVIECEFEGQFTRFKDRGYAPDAYTGGSDPGNPAPF